uniref:Flagellar associated protein n=1 Tax=Tetraselmis sp. GSL018 TaxID=582737 RepID=A0A061SN17_9CHLO|mmetsp:Transcript_9904/g.23647  ORF Transcript_9904/g.23647 Transcript_9904/m.23647 type:complete len:871 (+) Transcript_9904:287-2899(+)|eukprot:CAMPEP_0177617278 /NCGR_PEP_ID=MMETSP0419_2-20121207/24767_1 /TAXON_ID=582737 /ORGANISM="Tetraselmis sp., Strain GSL018" /LENGTH=870 /DNA_ID=CAMNT_0019115719 /DNA_START=185 /DNA_END=2797 /DNA_ORIENTATION=+
MAETGNKHDETAVQESAFEQLERDFQQVLEELVGDQSLERFRVEYEKIHRALKKSHESEKRLIKKCRELNSEIVANASKVQTALKLSEEDQNTIQALKKEIEKAWKMVDASHEKESRAKETIQQLKLEIANLTRLVEQGAGFGLGEESTVNELLKQKEELTRERDMQVDQIVSLRTELLENQEKVRSAEAEKLALESEIQGLKDSIGSMKAEGERETRKKQRMEKEMKELKSALEARQHEIKEKQTEVSAAEDQIAKLQQMLKDANQATEKVQKEFNTLSEKSQKLHHDLEEQMHSNTQLLAENSQRQVELKVKEDEIAQIKVEAQRLNKVKETTTNKVKNLEKQKAEIERTRDDLRTEIGSLEREIESMRKGLETERKKQDELMRERDILNKLKTQAESATQRQVDLVKINENTKRNLEQEIQGYKIEAQKQQKLIYQLEKEREKYGTEASEANSKYTQALEEVKLREMAIIDLQKKISEGENRLKQQQNLYEAVRSDRNLYSKNLIEAQDEIQEMKRKFKIINHQIEQLKEEISAKDLALVKEHFDHMKVEKEKESLRLELNKAKQQINEADTAITSQKAEIEKLNHIINEADQERLRQKKEYDIVINERDILGTQLIRRNDELALLYEKIKIQQSTLNKGQIQYRDRLNEIRVLKIKLNDLKRELHILKNSVANIDVLKREVHHLGRELLQERTKVKALSEELENPLNVHRWRKLEGSDPSTYELIQKIQTLQKRLIAKTEEVVEKDLLIQEKEKLYVELKNILARQPGPEVAEQLSVYQANLREKTKQMKAMAGELNMFQAQVNEYKYEIERLTRDLNDMKRKYFEQKRREQLERERAAKVVGPPTDAPVNTTQARFTGGGFSLST